MQKYRQTRGNDKAEKTGRKCVWIRQIKESHREIRVSGVCRDQ